MKKPSLSSLVLATLAYSDVFQYPLTEQELHQRLIGFFPEVNLKKINQTAKQIPQMTKIEQFWTLKGREQVVLIRQDREHISNFKLAELDTLISRLKKIATISSVYVTGSLAMQNVRSLADDIDLLIVTKPGTLWLTRVVVVLWTSLIGKYRLHGSSGEWGWCFNLWLDQNHLQVPKEDRSVYTAYEVVQAQLMLGTQNELLSANQWVNEYINYPVKAEKSKDYETRMKGNGEILNLKILSSFILLLVVVVELVSYLAQRLYMQPKRSREKVGRGFAFFHPRDTKNLILKKWQQKLEELGMSKTEREGLVQLFEEGCQLNRKFLDHQILEK